MISLKITSYHDQTENGAHALGKAWGERQNRAGMSVRSFSYCGLEELWLGGEMRVVVTGLIGQFPLGGVVWDYVQFALGFQALGHEVWYVEDSGMWPYDPIKKEVGESDAYAVDFLRRHLEVFGLGERWVYRNAATGALRGPGAGRFFEVLRTADLVVHVSTVGWFEGVDFGSARQVFVDGDPLFNQIGLLENPDAVSSQRLRAMDGFYSFGLKLGDPDCEVPDVGLTWRPMLQPVALNFWPLAKGTGKGWSTVMNWTSYAPKKWQGREFGQKDREFVRFIELPLKGPRKMRVAMASGVDGSRPTQRLKSMGWEVLEPDEVIPDAWSYREFISGSRGEWSVAKHGYVAARTGWFSGRTACYLAAGRPAVVQDTGWSEKLPHGKGLLAFRTMEEAVEGMARVEADYKDHQRAARQFALEFLDASKVCAALC